MDRFIYFIVNKQSRNGNMTFKRLLIELPKYTKNYKLFITEDITQLEKVLLKIKMNIQEKDLIVVVGGDGSLNQFVTLYMEQNLSNPIGYIPAGSGNDFARTHQISNVTEKAIKQLFKVTEKQKLSVIYAYQNDKIHYAVNSIGIGIDGLITELVNSENIKKKLGPFSYLSVLHIAFTKQKKFSLTLTIDKDSFHFKNVQLALIANNPYFGGGIKIIPEADSKDDILDLLIANNVSTLDLLSILPKIIRNKKQLLHPKIHSFKTKTANISVDSKQYAQKDGEVFYQNEFNYTFDTKEISFWI